MTFLQPLSEATLRSTLALTARCFPTDNAYRWALPLSASPEHFGSLGAAAGIVQAHQWILAAEGDANRIIGTFGLYATAEDMLPENRFTVLNWFCVDPEFRGHGLGRRLWNECLRAAAELGARHLIFYSSTEEHHQAAERLYLAGGCQRRLGPELPDVPGRITLFNRPLVPVDGTDQTLLARIDQSLVRLIQVDWDDALALRGDHALAGQAYAVAA